MKTIKEHLESLHEPYRTQALENLSKSNADKKSKTKSDALGSAFIWQLTNQGHNYWGSLHSQLQALEAQENISQQEKDEMIAEDMRNEADYEDKDIEAERSFEDE